MASASPPGASSSAGAASGAPPLQLAASEAYVVEFRRRRRRSVGVTSRHCKWGLVAVGRRRDGVEGGPGVLRAGAARRRRGRGRCGVEVAKVLRFRGRCLGSNGRLLAGRPRTPTIRPPRAVRRAASAEQQACRRRRRGSLPSARRRRASPRRRPPAAPPGAGAALRVQIVEGVERVRFVGWSSIEVAEVLLAGHWVLPARHRSLIERREAFVSCRHRSRPRPGWGCRSANSANAFILRFHRRRGCRLGPGSASASNAAKLSGSARRRRGICGAASGAGSNAANPPVVRFRRRRCVRHLRRRREAHRRTPQMPGSSSSPGNRLGLRFGLVQRIEGREAVLCASAARPAKAPKSAKPSSGAAAVVAARCIEGSKAFVRGRCGAAGADSKAAKLLAPKPASKLPTSRAAVSGAVSKVGGGGGTATGGLELAHPSSAGGGTAGGGAAIALTSSASTGTASKSEKSSPPAGDSGAAGAGGRFHIARGAIRSVRRIK